MSSKNLDTRSGLNKIQLALGYDQVFKTSVISGLHQPNHESPEGV